MVHKVSNSKRFKLPANYSPGDFKDALAAQWPSTVDAPFVKTWRLYDTFDRRLLAALKALYWTGETLVLCSLPTGNTILECQETTMPRFAAELPESGLQMRLAAIIEMRALLEFTTLQTSTYDCWVQDETGKPVSRAVLIEGSVQIEGAVHTKEAVTQRACYLTLEPFRGCAKETKRIVAYLQRSLNIERTDESIQFWAIQTANHGRQGYSSKIDVQLQSGLAAGDATRRILRRLLETMLANEEGIKADIDTEFLHDYRVAVRRTRSALSQIRKVLPPEESKHFQQQFGALGQLTNDLRDLDVYLLAEVDFRSVLPDAMQGEIAPLFDHLRSHRADALAKVINGLESKEYATMLEGWERFLGEPSTHKDAANAAVPIISLARRRIYRQYRRVVRDGTYILEHTEDELLHALRIECKKLRYLLEFFASLFPPKKIRRQVKQLKRLQDNLGAFNDLAMQQAYLLEIVEELDVEDPRTRKGLVAIGILVEKMAREQEQVKADFAGTFTEFASPAHQKKFARLFAKGKTNTPYIFPS